MTNPDVTNLKQLDGAVVGDKGSFPAAVRAMLVKAGVDWNSLHVVQEGYDPTVLTRRQDGLAALTGFVSNEPNQLKEDGYKVTVWQPIKYGIPSSLGAMAVNPAFAKAHPTAVEDILRPRAPVAREQLAAGRRLQRTHSPERAVHSRLPRR